MAKKAQNGQKCHFWLFWAKLKEWYCWRSPFFMKTSFSLKNRIFQKIHNSPKSDGVGSPLIPMVLPLLAENV